MSQALGEMIQHLSDTSVRASDPRTKYSTMLLSLASAVGRDGGPEGELELAALLESEGITDAVAARYGSQDVFALAHELLMLPRPLDGSAQPAPPASAKFAPRLLLLSLSRSVLMIAMMGMLLVGVQWYERSMRALGVPSWTTMLGLFAAMAIAGGMMQATGWRVSQTLSQGNLRAVRPLLLLGLAFGMSIALLVSALLVGGGRLLELPPAGLVGLGASCLALTFLLLLSGSLVLLERTHLAGAALGLAGGTTWLVSVARLIAHDTLTLLLFSYLMAIVLLIVLLAISVRRLSRATSGRGIYHVPPVGQLLYNATPYLGYGALAVVYVFAGQLNGWVGRVPDGWTRDQAIAALNVVHLVSLVTLVISQGVAEYALRIFWEAIRGAQSQALICDYTTISASVQAFLRRHLRMVLLGQALAAVGMTALVQWLWARYPMVALLGPLEPAMLYIGLAGYTLLAWGLYGCSFAVTVTRPWLAVRMLLAATLIEFASGLLLGRVGGFEFSVLGTVIGGACLVYSTRQAIARLLDRVDYLLYQAF